MGKHKQNHLLKYYLLYSTETAKALAFISCVHSYFLLGIKRCFMMKRLQVSLI